MAIENKANLVIIEQMNLIVLDKTGRNAVWKSIPVRFSGDCVANCNGGTPPENCPLNSRKVIENFTTTQNKGQDRVQTTPEEIDKQLKNASCFPINIKLIKEKFVSSVSN